MTTMKKYLLGLVVCLTLMMGSLYLIPLGSYLPEVERLISKQLQSPVKIDSVNLAALPLPHLQVHGLNIGGENGIDVQTIAITPDFMALLSGRREVRQISLTHARVHYETLQKLIAVQQALPATGKSSMTLREFTASDVTLVTPWLTLADIETTVSFDQTGKLEKIWGALDKQHLTATLLPQANRHFAVQIVGNTWSPPPYPRIVLDSLQINGIVSEHDFVAEKLTATLGDIQLSALGTVSFGNAWRVSAQLEQLDAPVEQLVKLLDKPMEIKGNVNVKGKLEGRGIRFADLKNQATFTGEVTGKQLQMQLVPAAEKPLQISNLTANLLTQGNKIDLSEVHGELYEGKLTGLVGFSGAERALNAEIAISEVDLQPLVAALTNRVILSGRLSGSSKMAIGLNELANFPQNAQINGDFRIQKGALSKVDLLKAASVMPSKTPEKTDQPAVTEFEDFTGLAQVDSNGYHFRNLNLTSGVLNAQGKVDLTPKMQLSGALDANLKGTLNIVSVPLVISGTLDQPVVAPSGAFLAGAALGTAVLPGIGTVVGMKIGGLFNKIFGQDDNSHAAKSTVPSR